MSCICFLADMSISANKPLFWAQQQYFAPAYVSLTKKLCKSFQIYSVFYLHLVELVPHASICWKWMDWVNQVWMTFGNWCSCTTIVNNNHIARLRVQNPLLTFSINCSHLFVLRTCPHVCSIVMFNVESKLRGGKPLAHLLLTRHTTCIRPLIHPFAFWHLFHTHLFIPGLFAFCSFMERMGHLW